MPPLSCVLENGRLFVRETEPSWSDPPRLFVRYWATRFTKRDLMSWDESTMKDAAEIKVLKHNHGMGYSLKFPGCGFWSEVQCAPTERPVRVDELPYPCPKVRAGIPTRYRNGYWEKCLRTGWQPA